MAAGHAGACLHTMVLMQAYQVDILKGLAEGEGQTPEDLAELHRAADLSLCVTKETARVVGRSIKKKKTVPGVIKLFVPAGTKRRCHL